MLYVAFEVLNLLYRPFGEYSYEDHAYDLKSAEGEPFDVHLGCLIPSCFARHSQLPNSK